MKAFDLEIGRAHPQMPVFVGVQAPAAPIARAFSRASPVSPSHPGRSLRHFEPYAAGRGHRFKMIRDRRLSSSLKRPSSAPTGLPGGGLVSIPLRRRSPRSGRFKAESSPAEDRLVITGKAEDPTPSIQNDRLRESSSTISRNGPNRAVPEPWCTEAHGPELPAGIPAAHPKATIQIARPSSRRRPHGAIYQVAPDEMGVIQRFGVRSTSNRVAF
jgi:hypothetical protein